MRQDESTASEESQEQKRSQDKTTEQTNLLETGEVSSNPNFAALAGITLIGLALCGYLGMRAIWPGRG